MKTTIENFVGIFENAFSDEYCDRVVQYFHDMRANGYTSNRQQLENIPKLIKDDEVLFAHDCDVVPLKASGSLHSELNSVLWEKVYPIYVNTYGVLSDVGNHSSFCFKIQETKIGQGYHVWHCEADSRIVSNRLLVWTLYLNDVEEGGETEFLYYPKRVKPKKGSVMIFPAAFTHTHRGNPPISNTKYLSTGWIEY